MGRGGLHEDFGREDKVKSSSDRGFGLVFAAVFAIVGSMSWWSGGRLWPYWLVAAVLMAIVALTVPGVLAPANRLWTRIGLLLFVVVSPVALGIVYVTTVIPTGLIMRALGKDPLRLRREPGAASYWIVRDPPGPLGETMRNQF